MKIFFYQDLTRITFCITFDSSLNNRRIMKTEQSPYELTLDLMAKSGVDIHTASIAKHYAVIEMTGPESKDNIEKVKSAFLSRWGHAYSFDKDVFNNAINAHMIYFNAI